MGDPSSSEKGHACTHLGSMSFSFTKERFSSERWRIAMASKQMGCKQPGCRVCMPQVWACLADRCTFVGCGRDQLQHAMQHATSEHHPVCINLTTRMTWCYSCDKELLDPELSEAHRTLLGYVRDLLSPPTPKPASTSMVKAGAKAYPRGQCGMQNVGNTCYLNSAMQALSHCTPLHHYMRHCSLPPHIVSSRQRIKLSMRMQALVQALWSGNQRALSPMEFVRDVFDLFPAFSGYGQQDTQEFIVAVLDRLHEETKIEIHPKTTSQERSLQSADHITSSSSSSSSCATPTPAPSSPPTSSPSTHDPSGDPSAPPKPPAPPPKVFSSAISDVFEGTLLSKAKCLNCGKTSPTKDKFYDISVSISQKRVPKPDPAKKSRMGWLTSMTDYVGLTSPTVSLEDCLHNYCSVEGLTGGDKYRCEFCKALHDSEKSLSIVKLPEVLCVHIKRFRYDSYFASKLSNHVLFPLRGLDMTPCCATEGEVPPDPALYDLFAVVVHSGSPGGGHYIAYAKNSKSGKWFLFDDSHVTEVREDEVAQMQAYVLFYQQRPSAQREEERKVVKGLKKKGTPTDYACLPRDWWMRWRTTSHSSPIDNTPFICKHDNMRRWAGKGGVEGQVKTVPLGVYEYIQGIYGGGPLMVPPFSEGGVGCSECLADQERLAERRRSEREAVSKHDRQALQPGEYWCLVDTRWIDRWKEFIQQETTDEPPGPITNANLLADVAAGVPRKNLSRGRDYRGIVPGVWQLFMEAYGGGPPVFRKSLDIYDPPVKPDGSL